MEFNFKANLDLDHNGILTVEEVDTALRWWNAQESLLKVPDVPQLRIEGVPILGLSRSEVVLENIRDHSLWNNLIEGGQKLDPAHRVHFSSEMPLATQHYLSLGRQERIWFRRQLSDMRKRLEEDPTSLPDAESVEIFLSETGRLLKALAKNWIWLESSDGKIGVTEEDFQNFRRMYLQKETIPKASGLKLGERRLIRSRVHAAEIAKKIEIDDEPLKRIVVRGLDRLAETPTGERLLKQLSCSEVLEELKIVSSRGLRASYVAGYDRTNNQLIIDREFLTRKFEEEIDEEDKVESMAETLGHEIYHAMRTEKQGSCAEEAYAFAVGGLILFELGARISGKNPDLRPLFLPKNLYSSVFTSYSDDYETPANFKEFLERESIFDDPEWKEHVADQWKQRFPDESPRSLLLETVPVDGTVDDIPFVVRLRREDKSEEEAILTEIQEFPGTQVGPDTQEEAWAIRDSDSIPVRHSLDNYEVSLLHFSGENWIEWQPCNYESLKRLIAQEPEWLRNLQVSKESR